MATAKKKPATKVAAKKTATPRKTTIKSAPKKVSAIKAKAVAEHQSFRQSREKSPFMTFKFTEQSVYWLILSVLVLGLGAWVMHLNVKIQNIYDQVELNTQLHETYTIPAASAEKPANTEPAAE